MEGRKWVECDPLSPQGRPAASMRPPSSAVLLLGLAFSELLCAPFRVEVHGAEHLRHAPGALVLSNHRRDSDGPILARVLMQRQRWRLGGVAPYFVGREDMFRKGFLDAYLDTWPQAVRALFARLSVGPLLHVLRVRPIRRIPEYTMSELLADAYAVLGDVPLPEVLCRDWSERFARHAGIGSDRLSVGQALTVSGTLLHQRHAFRRLRREALRTLMPFERGVIAAHLQHFVELVEAGETLLLEPEGRVSPDGRFHRTRQAVHHLLNVPARRPHVLPVAVSYDFMRPGRSRVLVRVGPPRHDLNGLSRRATDSAVRRAVLEHWTITLSHLAARYLRDRGDRRLTRENREDFARFVAGMTERCQTLGVAIDPGLLEPASRTRREAECLAFWRRTRGRVADARLEFLNNELDAVAAIHPGLLPGGRQ